MSVPFKKSPVVFNQRLLFPSNIFDLLPDDHECYLYNVIYIMTYSSNLIPPAWRASIAEKDRTPIIPG